MPRAITSLLLLMLSVVVSPALATLYTCGNSTMLYTVSDESGSWVIFQINNETRAYALNASSWDDWVPAEQQNRGCDFQIETRASSASCVRTKEENGDDNDFCSGDRKSSDQDVISEHEVMIACTTDVYAYAKVSTKSGVHFMVAFESLESLKEQPEWSEESFEETVEAFQGKQYCGEDDEEAEFAGAPINLHRLDAFWMAGLAILLTMLV